MATTPGVTVRYWAGARRAAGRAEEQLTASSIGELRALLADRPALSSVVPVASFLLDGQATNDTIPLPDGGVVDVLPPFAGGCTGLTT